MSTSHPQQAGMSGLSVYPCLTYRDVTRAIAWLETAFGIQGEALVPADSGDAGSIEHALLRAGRGTILVESEAPDELHGPHTGRGWVYVSVSDADKHCERARAAGAHILTEPHDFGAGHRGYSATDYEENLWTFGTAEP